jgi:hypothetical protein
VIVVATPRLIDERPDLLIHIIENSRKIITGLKVYVASIVWQRILPVQITRSHIIQAISMLVSYENEP